jgi:hypothetical protein
MQSSAQCFVGGSADVMRFDVALPVDEYSCENGSDIEQVSDRLCWIDQ